jgi:hypothetical protein
MVQKHPGSRCIVALEAALLVLVATLAARPLAAQNVTFTPTMPTAADQVVVQIFTLCYKPFSEPPTIVGQTITFTANPGQAPPCAAPPNVPHLVVSFRLPPLPVGTYTVQGVSGTALFFSSTLYIAPGPASTALYLHDNRFVASVSFNDPTAHGAPTAAQAVQLSDGSGYFWFFDNESPELTLKLIDGAEVNGKFWVFLASATDVAYTLTITDLFGNNNCPSPPCLVKTYTARAGHNQNVIDINAFPSLSPPPG